MDLVLRRVLTRLIPTKLSFLQKQYREQVQGHFDQISGSILMDYIITHSDEMGVYEFEMKTNHQAEIFGSIEHLKK